MIYRLLGELQIDRGGRPLRLPGGPTLLLLAALLLGVNREMSKTDLVRAAWGTDGMSNTQLYKRVKEVRGLLAEIGRDGDLLNHHGFGYELQAADDEIDTLQFERLVRHVGSRGGRPGYAHPGPGRGGGRPDPQDPRGHRLSSPWCLRRCALPSGGCCPA
jgi:hypothetical protein